MHVISEWQQNSYLFLSDFVCLSLKKLTQIMADKYFVTVYIILSLKPIDFKECKSNAF